MTPCIGAFQRLLHRRRAPGPPPAPAPQEPTVATATSEKQAEEFGSGHIDMENIVVNHDFSNALHSWHPNQCHGYVASKESGLINGVLPYSGASYAVVTNRHATWQGLEQDITKSTTLDTNYTVTTYVRVYGDTLELPEVIATLRLENQDSSVNFIRVGSVVGLKEDWVKLEGSFVLSSMPSKVVFYIEGPPPGVDLLIDFVSICYEKPNTMDTLRIMDSNNLVRNHDFAQGIRGWRPNCCQAFVASEWSGFLNGIRGNSGECYAIVTKRKEFWQGLEQDITQGVSVNTPFSVSAFVRVYADAQERTEVKATLRLHLTDNSVNYVSVGRALVSKDCWEKLEGSFCLKTMPKSVVFYLEGPPRGVDLLIDSVTIMPAGQEMFNVVNSPSSAETVIENPQFENGLVNWAGRGCEVLRHEFLGYGNVSPFSGSYFASATKRQHSWNGIQQDITSRVRRKLPYEVISVVRVFGAASSAEVLATLWVQESDGRERYIGIAKTQASQNEWVHLRGMFILHGQFSKAVIFIEGPPPGTDILVDSIIVVRAKRSPAARPASENILHGVNILHNSDLSDGLSGWSPLGSCKLSACVESPDMLPLISRESNSSNLLSNGRYILCENRSEVWMGPSQTITDKLRLHTTYFVSAWVRAGSGASGPHHINVALSVDDQWVNGGQGEAFADRWTEIRGSFKIEKQPSRVSVYVQGPSPGVDLRVMRLHIIPLDRKARFRILKEKADKIRKRDVVLKFEGSKSENITSMNIRINQIENSFPLGTCIGRANLENEDYADFFLKNFNWAVFENELKWYWTEAEQGKLNYRDADELLDFCHRHKKEVRGHCIFWEVEDAVQPWLRLLHGQNLMDAVQNRLHSLLSRYRGKFRHHDVNNEMLHGSFFQDRLGNDISAHMFREAHRLDPTSILFVNDYNVEDGCDSRSTPEKYIEQVFDLQERGAPVGGIGVQCHISHPVGEIICASFDKLAILGLPVWITELDVSAVNEHIRADDLEVVLREAFAHPAIEGIVLWGFWELHMFRKDAHLVDADGTINEAGKRYLALKQEWLSRAEGHTDNQGKFVFRGYHGTYALEIETPAGKIQRSFAVEKGDFPQVVTIAL